MSYFITVLTDTCEVKTDTYVIHTRMYQSTYRTEVFKNGTLIDKVEETLQSSTQAVFHSTYKDAHKKMRMKYCISTTIPEKDMSKKRVPQSQISPKMLKIILSAMVLMLALIFWYFTVFKYSRMYINMLDENEKKTYMESIEIKTHYLATHCLTLAKQHRAEDTLFTTKQCTLWCKNKQMDKESCHLINAYIQQNYSVKTKDNNESATTAKGYTILPEGTLRLKKEKHTILQINNLGSSPLTLFVSNLILEQNKNEEIVQFKDGNSQLILDKNKMGEFSIFLEPSYYNQFKSGAYNGHIELTALQGEKNHTIIKKFTFMVE